MNETLKIKRPYESCHHKEVRRKLHAHMSNAADRLGLSVILETFPWDTMKWAVCLFQHVVMPPAGKMA